MPTKEMARSGSYHRWNEDERSAFIARLSIFGQVSPAIIHEIATHLRPKRVRRGEAVFLVGELADALHFLATGRVKLVHETDDGREVIIRLLRPGEMFGGAGVWGDPRYPGSAFAQEDSVVLLLSASTFTNLLGTHPELALSVIRLLATRLRDAEARIRDLQTEHVEQRIARVLLRLANKTGIKTQAGIEIGVPLSRQDLAELSGTTLSTASRTLSAWHQQGIVGAGREHITILLPHALVTIAEGLRQQTSVRVTAAAELRESTEVKSPGRSLFEHKDAVRVGN